MIKTLALSRVIYLVVNLSDPPDDFLCELNALLFQILWDGMQSKISRKIVCISRKTVCISRKTALAGRLSALAGRLSASQNHEDERLGMLDAFTVLSCMKMGWMRRLMSKGSGFGDNSV